MTYDGVLLSDQGLAAWEKDYPRHYECLERTYAHPHLRRLHNALLAHQANYAGEQPE